MQPGSFGHLLTMVAMGTFGVLLTALIASLFTGFQDITYFGYWNHFRDEFLSLETWLVRLKLKKPDPIDSLFTRYNYVDSTPFMIMSLRGALLIGMSALYMYSAVGSNEETSSEMGAAIFFAYTFGCYMTYWGSKDSATKAKFDERARQEIERAKRETDQRANNKIENEAP